MKKFESLLLKTGNPDLICAYIEELNDSVSCDFRQAVSRYGKEMQLKISHTLQQQTDILNMDIYRFIDEYCTGPITRIKVMMEVHEIHTVRELITCRKSTLMTTRTIGKKTMMSLIEDLERIGLSLKD